MMLAPWLPRIPENVAEIIPKVILVLLIVTILVALWREHVRR